MLALLYIGVVIARNVTTTTTIPTTTTYAIDYALLPDISRANCHKLDEFKACVHHCPSTMTPSCIGQCKLAHLDSQLAVGCLDSRGEVITDPYGVPGWKVASFIWSILSYIVQSVFVKVLFTAAFLLAISVLIVIAVVHLNITIHESGEDGSEATSTDLWTRTRVVLYRMVTVVADQISEFRTYMQDPQGYSRIIQEMELTEDRGVPQTSDSV